MRRKARILTPALTCLLFGSILAYKPSSPGVSPHPQPSYYSPSLGQLVLHPESLSGVWEASDGNGGAVGIHLRLITTAPADVNTLNGVPQTWQSLTLGVYQRKGTTIQMGETNYFSDSYPDSGGIHFEEGRLRLHFVSLANPPAVDLDLLQQPGDAWVGRLHRGDFDSSVKLLRPGVGGRFPLNPIAATWSESDSFMPARSCVHIAQGTPTEFTASSDSLQVLGSMQYANGIPKPVTTMESYGELMKVHREEGGPISFELYAFSPVCCSHAFFGALTSDGARIQGAWPAGPNQAPRPGSWKKMPGNSCSNSEPVGHPVQH